MAPHPASGVSREALEGMRLCFGRAPAECSLPIGVNGNKALTFATDRVQSTLAALWVHADKARAKGKASTHTLWGHVISVAPQLLKSTDIKKEPLQYNARVVGPGQALALREGFTLVLVIHKSCCMTGNT